MHDEWRKQGEEFLGLLADLEGFSGEFQSIETTIEALGAVDPDTHAGRRAAAYVRLHSTQPRHFASIHMEMVNAARHPDFRIELGCLCHLVDALGQRLPKSAETSERFFAQAKVLMAFRFLGEWLICDDDAVFTAFANILREHEEHLPHIDGERALGAVGRIEKRLKIRAKFRNA